MKPSAVAIFFFFWGFGHSTLQAAQSCNIDNCKIENDCRCSSTINPIADPADPAPQLIAITVSESIVEPMYNDYLKVLFFDKTNPDGAPIGLTFYVPHEYTDYSLVHDLYVRGYEIGDNSITRNPYATYWPTATQQDLEEEFGGQKIILSTFGNIPADDITGARTPQLQLEGDVSFAAYAASGLSYDNSWATSSTDHIFPYTLDYASTQQCNAFSDCPTEAHPGFWVAPITSIKGVNNTECNSLATCLIQGTSDEISTWLYEQVDAVRNENRVPLTLRLDSYWFSFTPNSFEGFMQFLDKLKSLNDVFLVSVQDIIKWMENPVPLSQYVTPDYSERTPNCLGVDCHLTNEQGEDKLMKSCVPCPPTYPWKGNPLGETKTNFN